MLGRAMRENLQALRLLIGTALRTAPGRVAVALLETVRSAATALNALWAGLLVAAVINHAPRQAVVAVAALVLTTAAGWALALTGAEARVTMAERVGFALDRRIAEITASIPTLTHHERPDFADQVQILRQNRGILGGGMSSLMYNIDYLSTAVITMIMAIAIDPRLLVIALTAVPPLVSSRLRYRWSQGAEDDSAEPGRLTRHLTDAMVTPDTAMEIRVFGLQQHIRQRLTDAYRRWRAPLDRAARRTATLGLAEDIFFVLIVTGVIAWLVISAQPDTAAKITVAVIAARQLQNVVVQTIHGLAGEGGLADTLRNLRRLLWLQQYADREAGIGPSADVTHTAPDELRQGIRLSDVTFAYPGQDVRSLDKINLTLSAGKIIAVVGENGAGKTTLVKLLLGMYRPTAGRISIDQTPLDNIDIEDWRRHGSGAFQDHAQFEFIVQDAIGIGDTGRAGDRAVVAAAADRAGAAALLHDLPHGLDTQLGVQWTGGVNLSGGQWQTVALARAMMRPDPLLLILDEPTAALDAHAEHQLFQHYINASEHARESGGITLLITHRFTTISNADLIVVLDRGKIIEQGTHTELMHADGRYADLYRLQSRGYQ